jgi:hypothetical protein
VTFSPRLSGAPSNTNRPISRNPTEHCFTFSLRDWRQLDGFGVGQQNPSWFVAVLNRLSEMCKMPVERFHREASIQGQFHYHSIKWEHAPLSREDFDWVDPNIIENEDEFTFFQFSVSQSLGRVVGYFEGTTFFVLLFDPQHNIYLTKYSNFKVTNTTVGKCDFSALLETTQRLVSYASDGGVSIPAHMWSGTSSVLTDSYANLIVARVGDETISVIDGLVSEGLCAGSSEFVVEAVQSYAKELKSLS